MPLEPRNQLPNVSEHLIMEVQPRTLHLYQLLHRLLIPVQVNQHKVLGILGTASKEVMNQRRVLSHLDLCLLLNLFHRLGHELPVRCHVLHQAVHWSYVLVNHFVQTLVDFVVLVAYNSVHWGGCGNACCYRNNYSFVRILALCAR